MQGSCVNHLTVTFSLWNFLVVEGVKSMETHYRMQAVYCETFLFHDQMAVHILTHT
jgi:hypothetical protein